MESEQQKKSDTKITVAYVYAVPDNYRLQAQRFVKSFLENPPGVEHSLIVIANGGHVTKEIRTMFAPIMERCPSWFFEHDDSGWDIGAYLALVNHPAALGDCDMLVCFGGHSYLKRAGWLKRLAQVWSEMGPGMYGTLGTYEVRPHLNTTGFAIPPELLRRYPVKVVNKKDRYEFEHGQRSFHRLVASLGYPVRLVTWDGVYPIAEWRKPPNVYRRGDQSNCLTFFNHTLNFEKADPLTRKTMSMLADTVTDKDSLKEVGLMK